MLRGRQVWPPAHFLLVTETADELKPDGKEWSLPTFLAAKLGFSNTGPLAHPTIWGIAGTRLALRAPHCYLHVTCDEMEIREGQS